MSTFTPPNFPIDETAGARLANLNLGDEMIIALVRALSEDLGSGDVTTDSIVPSESRAVAHIVAKQDGTLSGLSVAQATFLLLTDDMQFDAPLVDGIDVIRGQTILKVSGRARSILSGERTALNFLARMSGIATLTRQFVNAVAGTKAKILDTRKTAPSLRAIDKLAVRHGGADNHRFGLYDMILIKNNHIDYAKSLSSAVNSARASQPDLEIEIEARSIEEVQEALKLGIDRILLDNMSIVELKQAVALSGGKAKLEASGNVNLDNVRAIAETGVEFISVGALTHSAPAFDVSLRWIR